MPAREKISVSAGLPENTKPWRWKSQSSGIGLSWLVIARSASLVMLAHDALGAGQRIARHLVPVDERAAAVVARDPRGAAVERVVDALLAVDDALVDAPIGERVATRDERPGRLLVPGRPRGALHGRDQRPVLDVARRDRCRTAPCRRCPAPGTERHVRRAQKSEVLRLARLDRLLDGGRVGLIDGARDGDAQGSASRAARSPVGMSTRSQPPIARERGDEVGLGDRGLGRPRS